MSFDVLLRQCNINQNILCEASAGTGKTFTIEHLFIRRLIQEPKVNVREIAVLTFTKAVAAELTVRLKRALDKAIIDLRTKNEQAADYLIAVIEEEKAEDTANLLEIARDAIEFCAIDTIHGFCYRCLSEYATGVLNDENSKFATGADCSYYIEEFFRIALDDDSITKQELRALLVSHKRDFALLLQKLTASLWDENKQPVQDVQELICQIKNTACPWTEDEIKEQLAFATYQYKGLRSKDKELKSGIQESIDAFASLFIHQDVAAFIKNPFFAEVLFSDPKANSNVVDTPVVIFARQLQPLLYRLAHPDSIFERFKLKCRKFVSRQLENRGLYVLHELLITMEEKLSDNDFTQYLKNRFSAVIVDEFQDTDPRQWNIMQKLFVQNWQGFLYIVGDPKQAIYSFRQADVYCYMQAKNRKNQAVVTLTKNFRSSPELVSALNTLFVGPHTPALFYLPKLATSLDVAEISAGADVANLSQDTIGAIHFFNAEGLLGRKKTWPTEQLESDCFFSFIAQEIVSLHKLGIAYSQMAILVKDRYQADRVERYLKNRGQLVHSWRKKSVIGSEAHLFLQRLIASLAAVKNRSLLIDLVMRHPFAYSSANCDKLGQNLEYWAQHVSHLLFLKKQFDVSCLAGLIFSFLQSTWPGFDKCMKEVLWQEKDFLYDLDLIVELVLDHSRSLDELQEYMDELKCFSQSEKDQEMSRYNPALEGVQILTLHASKGLEFEVVFALALASRSPQIDNHDDAAEIDAEKLRQYYVACTRAKKRLYLPVAIQQDIHEIKPGMASPMELFLQTTSVDTLIARSGGTVTSVHLKPNNVISALEQVKQNDKAPILFSPYMHRQNFAYLTSFSKLNISVYAPKVKVEDALPIGSEGGIVFHELLAELLPCRALLDHDYVKQHLASTVFEGFEAEVHTILQRALNVRLGAFSLAEIDVKRLQTEVSFCKQEDNRKVVRGTIDLFFEHDGKFYLIDWKSNALESYSKQNLQNEVQAHGYDLQAKIYTEAFLGSLGIEQSCFGGFYFVFLRALNDKTNEGIYRYEY